MDIDPPPAHLTPASITLIAIPADGAVPQSLPLEAAEAGEYHFSLECLPGADAIHLLIAIGGQPRLRAEVRAQAGEVVRCALHLTEEGEPVLEAGSHQVLFLPVESAYGPLPPIPPPAPRSAWDICLVIDATTRSTADSAPPSRLAGLAEADAAPPLVLDDFLLNQPQLWAAVVEPVVELFRQLADAGPAGQGCRFAVIAFGDEAPPLGVYAADLMPAYRLRVLPYDRPEHLLLPLAAATLTDLLLTRLTATPGGDFVDALADALAAAGWLQWGDERRRLLVLIGDSPGHATAHPVPYGGDALARRADVHAEAARLHREHQVEILTLYHAPAAALVKTLLDAPRALIDHARDQYRRLASEPRLAFTTANFDPRGAAATLLGRNAPLGRGPSWGRRPAIT
ncbi:hypothetical protein [uncultured Thiodictyon sp.]|uniref:hypothetical protein n=1 Tax=uncultured Thiodictyon sp. TaxID=1846217 RepID=UPI0025DB0A68|nr:hypothetical protein [uncultured Thiodictyon sp.]